MSHHDKTARQTCNNPSNFRLLIRSLRTLKTLQKQHDDDVEQRKKGKTQNERKALITKIHIAKKDLAMDDETYRDVLMRVTGKESCKKMTLSELKKVIGDMKRLGFKVKQDWQKPAPKHGRKPTTTPDRQALLSKVGAILADCGLHWNYAHGMAQKMFDKELVTWLNAEQLYKLVQALAVYQKRHAKNQTAGQ